MLSPASEPASVALPLTGSAAGRKPFAWRGGSAIDTREFLADVARLAAALPDRGQVVNFCSDRYHFTVAFSAAMLRGQVTHLPNDGTTRSLNLLVEKHADLYGLTDRAPPLQGLPWLRVDRLDGPNNPVADIPELPSTSIVAQVYTGGTTGHPLPNAKSWGALVQGARRISDAIGMDAHPDATILATVPPQHMYGLEFSILQPLQGAAAMHVGHPFYPADIEKSANEPSGPVVLVTTPIHLKALIASRPSLPRLAKVVCATAPLALSLAEQTERVFEVPVIEIYGCSEAGSVASRRPVVSERWHTLDGISLRLRGGMFLADVPYLDEPVVLQDVMELASPSEFELLGRSSEMVIVAGKRASLSGLNTILNEVEGVVDGVFHATEQNQEETVARLVAFVVAPGLSALDIRDRLRDKIDAAFMPRPLYVVDALPRTGVGKITRVALTELERCAQDSG